VAYRLGRYVLALAVVMLFGASVAQAQDGYKVVVNVANPIDALSKSEAARLFLTRTTWDSGDPVFPVDLVANSSVRADFSRDVLGMSPNAVLQQWKRNAAEAPPSVATDREVLAFVRLKRGAIGYVSPAANLQGVKVVAVIKPR
jgi:ABC-type phosphate transport system substrate-binding protein